MKNYLKKLPFFKECFQYSVPLFQCPSFLFLILGILNIAAMLSTYFIATRFSDEPEVSALITISVSLVIFVIGSVVVNSFDKLAQANKMKTEFVRIASHQLRSPLTSLRWAVDQLMEGVVGRPTEEQIEYLKIISESNQRMLKLINDLLDVSKIEMGSFMFKFEPVDLEKVAKEVIEGLAPFAKANNILLNLVFDPQLPPVHSDQERIRMVFSNLIDNAIKYNLGKGQVDVGAKLKDKNIQVFVKDNGVGIPKEQQKNIFQKFFRSDNAMKHQTIGTGLGLFIVKAIVEANKGKIWFESEENKGTTFLFEIPIAKK